MLRPYGFHMFHWDLNLHSNNKVAIYTKIYYNKIIMSSYAFIDVRVCTWHTNA